MLFPVAATAQQSPTPQPTARTALQQQQKAITQADYRAFENWLVTHLKQKGIDTENTALHFVLLVDGSDRTQAESKALLDVAETFLKSYPVASYESAPGNSVVAKDYITVGIYQLDSIDWLPEQDWSQAFAEDISQRIQEHYPPDTGGHDNEYAFVEATKHISQPANAVYLVLAHSTTTPPKDNPNYPFTTSQTAWANLKKEFGEPDYNSFMVNLPTEATTSDGQSRHNFKVWLYIPRNFQGRGTLNPPRQEIRQKENRPGLIVTEETPAPTASPSPEASPVSSPTASPASTNPEPPPDPKLPLYILAGVVLVSLLGATAYWLQQLNGGFDIEVENDDGTIVERVSLQRPLRLCAEIAQGKTILSLTTLNKTTNLPLIDIKVDISGSITATAVAGSRIRQPSQLQLTEKPKQFGVERGGETYSFRIRRRTTGRSR